MLPMYTEKVMERFKNPKNAGELDTNDPDVVVGEVGNVRCGDVMRVYLKIKKADGKKGDGERDPMNDVIEDIKFLTYGCVSAIAASDMMCDLARGKTLAEALAITAQDITDGLGKLPPIKFHCSVLGSEALKKAVQNYMGQGKAEEKKGAES